MRKSLTILSFFLSAFGSYGAPSFETDYTKNPVLWARFQYRNQQADDGGLVQDATIFKSGKVISQFSFNQYDSFLHPVFLSEKTIILVTTKETYLVQVDSGNIEKVIETKSGLSDLNFNLVGDSLTLVSRESASIFTCDLSKGEKPKKTGTFDGAFVTKTLWGNAPISFLMSKGDPVYIFQKVNTNLVYKLNIVTDEVTQLFDLGADYQFVFSDTTGTVQYFDKPATQELFAYDLDTDQLKLVSKVPGKVFVCGYAGKDSLRVATDNGRRTFPQNNVIYDPLAIDGDQFYTLKDYSGKQYAFFIAKSE